VSNETLESLREQAKLLKEKRETDQQKASDDLERQSILDEIDISKLEGIGVRGLNHEVLRVAMTGNLVVLRPPTPLEWRNYVRRSKSGKDDDEVVEIDFVKRCLVFPDKVKLEQYLAVEPGLIVRLSLCCNTLAGLREEAALKK
jgi:hypothetical protein